MHELADAYYKQVIEELPKIIDDIKCESDSSSGPEPIYSESSPIRRHENHHKSFMESADKFKLGLKHAAQDMLENLNADCEQMTE